MRKIFTFVVALSLFFSFNLKAFATAPGPSWGGYNVMMFPCTCTPTPTMWHLFVPFYLNSQVPMANALEYIPGSFPYLYYFIHVGAWGLGKFYPVPTCFVGVYPYCVYMPSLGSMQTSGSSP